MGRRSRRITRASGVVIEVSPINIIGAERGNELPFALSLSSEWCAMCHTASLFGPLFYCSLASRMDAICHRQRVAGAGLFLPTLRQKSFAPGANKKVEKTVAQEERERGFWCVLLLVRDAVRCFADISNDLARCFLRQLKQKDRTIRRSQYLLLDGGRVATFICPSMPNQSKQVVTQSLVPRRKAPPHFNLYLLPNNFCFL